MIAKLAIERPKGRTFLPAAAEDIKDTPSQLTLIAAAVRAAMRDWVDKRPGRSVRLPPA